MVNWSGAIARKYDVLQQDANTRAMAATAEAELARARAAGMPSLTRSQAGLNDATARLTGVRADLAPGIAGSEIGLNSANAFRQRALGETAYDQNLPQIDLMRDQAFLADMKKSGLDVSPVDGNRLQTIVSDFMSTPAAIIAKAKQVMEPGSNVVKRTP